MSITQSAGGNDSSSVVTHIGTSNVGDYVESLRRICQSISSGIDLPSVLQAIVDALCDHTHWQLCFIYAMDTNGGFGEIAARRDRLEYTAESPQARWAFSGNPALDALRRNEVIAVPDVSLATDYPALLEAARTKGVVASAYIPLSSNDPSGRPMVLCVQSTRPVLDDKTQIPFLRAVASLASLAATNARLLMEARQVATRASESAALLSSVIDGVSAGRTSVDLLAEVELKTNQPLVVFDRQGYLTFTGRSPIPESTLSQDWSELVAAQRNTLYEAIDKAFERESATTVSVTVDLGDDLPPTTASATRYLSANLPAATVVTFPMPGVTAESQVSASTAAAIVLLRDRLSFEAQSNLQHDVITQLLEGTYGDGYEFASRAAHAGVDVWAPTVVIAALRTSTVSAERAGNMIRAHARRWPGFHVQYVSGYFVLLLPLNQSRLDQVDVFLRSLSAVVTDKEGQRGLILTRSEVCSNLEQFAAAWKECVQAIGLANQVHRRGIVGINEFGAYRLLLPAVEQRDLDDFINATIGPLLDNDREHQGALFPTIEAFTTFGGRFQETARHLNIHVSTLRYRLQRIEALLSRDLGDHEARFDILLATRLERLRRGSG
jgi:sugar diacid utilization regulator